MADPLATYLHDHLAGAALAIDLLEAMQEQYRGERLGESATAILSEVKADEHVLKELAETVGEGSDIVKDATAWMSEKASRLKLRKGTSGGLGTFEALEFLALGIQGKIALWSALSTVARSDRRLRGIDFDLLSTRARDQYAQVEECRLAEARTAFLPNS